jgi:type IV pilus assembly protein PilY1
MNDSVFGAPLVGGISVFPGDVGSVATAAYMTDADGTIWRIDLTGTAVGSYRATPLFDMFWNEGSADGQPAFDPPIVTADPLGNAVILQATGYVDLYDHFVRNKIVSITERFTASYATSTTTPGVEVAVGQVGADLNWQITLDPGEQLTGQLALFAGQLYFATFRGMPDRGRACAGGSSRLWGVHYLNAVDPASETGGNTAGSCISVSDPANTMPGVRWPVGAFAGMDGADGAGRCIASAEGEVITGLTIAQRATCSAIEETPIDDPFVGPATSIASAGSSGGRFELVAHSSGSRRSAPGATVADFAHALHGHRQFTRATGGYVGHVD